MEEETTSPGDSFRKKRFTAGSFLVGVASFIHNLPRLVRANRADRVDDQFAEKIMLAVTAVNECRYCTRYHTALARENDVDQATIDRILEGDVDAAVEERERHGLVFAQRYAETDGDPAPETIAQLRDAYGPAMASDVQAFVRAIYFGNLVGNTYDALKFAIGRHTNRPRDCLRRGVAATSHLLGRVRDSCPV